MSDLLDCDDSTLRDRMERSPDLVLAEVRRLQTGIARVRRLHVRDRGDCDECRDFYPCATLRALADDPDLTAHLRNGEQK